MMSRKRIVRQFMDLSAFDARSAMPIPLKDGFDRDTMKRLVQKQIVFQPEQARYYLDREALRAYEASEARQVLWLVIGVAVLTVVAVLVTLVRR